jgi:AhpD family alkylhydroperoxidase
LKLRLLDRILFHKVAPRQVRYLSPLDYDRTEGLAREVLEQMEQDFLVGPPITIHLPNPELLAGVWSMARECFAGSGEGRPLREVVSAAISQLNTCPYCLDIHTAMLHSFGLPDAAEAQITARWAAATLTPDAPILKMPPFGREDAPQIVGAALCFHYLNRMVNVFLKPLWMGPAWIKGVAIRMSGKILQPRLAHRNPVQGRFLNAVADASLPPEFEWTQANSHIAGGFLRFISAVERAGVESVDPHVRECVVEQIQAWRGETPGLGRDWIERSVARLDPRHRPAARLALMTALASYQVDETLVADFRRRQPADRDLVNLTSWASYAAVRRIASWLKASTEVTPARAAPGESDH